MHKPSILIAEDDEDLSDVLQLMLDADFDVTTASDGEQAIRLIQENVFHFIILDIHLPKKNGIAICQYVDTMSPKDQPGIIVLSGDMDDELIRHAYSYGVGDYIGKPFNVVAFHQRLTRFSRDLDAVNELRDIDLKKRSIAETAMKQAASYGAGLELLAKLNRCRDIESLLAGVTKGLLNQGYHTAVEFRYKDQFYHHDADTAECGENEKKVFQLLHDKGRIYNFGKRAIFNEVNSSLLIKNMPSEGTMSYDAAIDLFAKLVPALNSRFIDLMHVETLYETKGTLGDTVQIVTRTIAEMEEERQNHLQDIASTIGISFHELEMTEEQENFFLDLIEKKLGQNSGKEKFDLIVSLLQSCIDKLSDEITVDAEHEDEDDHNDDIELF